MAGVSDALIIKEGHARAVSSMAGDECSRHEGLEGMEGRPMEGRPMEEGRTKHLSPQITPRASWRQYGANNPENAGTKYTPLVESTWRAW